MSPPTTWLRDEHTSSFRSGYCDSTSDRERGCVAGASKGFWPLSGAELESWERAASACTARCRSCAACTAISFSRRNHECGWFAACAQPEALHREPYGFRTLLMAELDNATARQAPPDVHARLRRAVAPPGCADGPTERAGDVSFEWGSSRGQLGNRFEAAINALQTGACCASRVLLPPSLVMGGSPLAERPCVDFRALAAPPDSSHRAAACRQQARKDANHFYYNELASCHSAAERRAEAQLAALEYAQRFGALRCATPLPHTTLVAHVRSGDGVAAHQAHLDYGQPPVAYYLAAWRASGLPRLLVVTQDAHCAVARALRALGTSLSLSLTVQTSASFADDLRPLVCARHVVLSHSTLSTLLLGANPHLLSAYSYRPQPPNIWLASCRTRYYFATGVPREQHWTGSAEQQLEAVVAGGFEPIVFQRAQRSWCLSNVTRGRVPSARLADTEGT